MRRTCLFALAAAGLSSVDAHGRMTSPAARQDNIADENALVGGGPGSVHSGQGYLHGICGDAPGGQQRWAEPKPIVETYTEGSSVVFEAVLTAHHVGYMEFELCPSPAITETCFKTHRLLRTGCVGDPIKCRKWWKPLLQMEVPLWVARSYPSDAPVLPSGGGNTIPYMFRMEFDLPQGVTCTNCVLRWHYMTTNSCTSSGSAPEEFWNCADIRIEAADGTAQNTANDADSIDLLSTQPVNLRPSQDIANDFWNCPSGLPDTAVGTAGEYTCDLSTQVNGACLSCGGQMGCSNPVPVSFAPTASAPPTPQAPTVQAPTYRPTIDAYAPTADPTTTPPTTQGACDVPAWSASQVYGVNSNNPDVVERHGMKYKSRWWTQNDDPATNNAVGLPWEPLGPCTGTPTSPTPEPTTGVQPTPDPTTGAQPTSAPTQGSQPTPFPTIAQTSAPTTAPPTIQGACDVPAWSASQAYNGGDQVERNGIKYEARWWTRNNDPPAHTAVGLPWEPLGPCTGGDPTSPTPDPTTGVQPTPDPTVAANPTPRPTPRPTADGEQTGWERIMSAELIAKGHPWGIGNIRGVSGLAAAQLIFEDVADAIRNGPDDYKQFCNGGDEDSNKRECAAFLANVLKETGGYGAFQETSPVGTYCTENEGSPELQAAGAAYPCFGNEFIGRGAIQLTWNVNYGRFSEYYFGDPEVLLRNPESLEGDGPLGWAASLWFWMRDQDYGGQCPPQQHTSTMSSGSQSCHDAMASTDGGGFGQTIRIINGGYESCPTAGGYRSSPLYRIEYYLELCSLLQVPAAPGCVLDDPSCDVSGMGFFGVSGGEIGNPLIGADFDSQSCQDCEKASCSSQMVSKWLGLPQAVDKLEWTCV